MWWVVFSNIRKLKKQTDKKQTNNTRVGSGQKRIYFQFSLIYRSLHPLFLTCNIGETLSYTLTQALPIKLPFDTRDPFYFWKVLPLMWGDNRVNDDNKRESIFFSISDNLFTWSLTDSRNIITPHNTTITTSPLCEQEHKVYDYD